MVKKPKPKIEPEPEAEPEPEPETFLAQKGIVSFEYKTESGSLSLSAVNVDELWRALRVVSQAPEIYKFLGFNQGQKKDFDNKGVG